MPKINREEYEILQFLNNTKDWIVRNPDGQLWAVEGEAPWKAPFYETWEENDGQDTTKVDVNSFLFQFIQWEDQEPYNISELIEEYEYSTEHVSHVVNERVKALGKAWSESEETEVKKDVEWLKEEINQINPFIELTWTWKRKVLDLINQLDEPEVLSQEEVDQAYKDGYEKGKQHTFYKGYLEGLADKENEPETVADVVTTFWKSFERLKEVMSMEVEELEE